MTAWKDLERRVCVDFGGRRGGPTGASVSDCVGTPYSIETKRSSRPGPPVLARWIEQARRQGKQERLPWLLVVAAPNDRDPVAVLAYHELRRIARLSGIIPTPAAAATVDGQTTIEEAIREQQRTRQAEA